MKKALLFSFLVLIIPAVFAYETIIIKYPPGELWLKAYYKTVGLESILQYLPKGESNPNWKRSIIVHSYLESSYPVNIFISNET